MKFLHFSASILFILVFNIQLQAQVYVEPGVQKELNQKGFSSCVLAFEPLILKDKIPNDLTKTEKGKLAFTLLKEHLDKKMVNATNILKINHIKYRSGTVRR